MGGAVKEYVVSYATLLTLKSLPIPRLIAEKTQGYLLLCRYLVSRHSMKARSGCYSRTIVVPGSQIKTLLIVSPIGSLPLSEWYISVGVVHLGIEGKNYWMDAYY